MFLLVAIFGLMTQVSGNSHIFAERRIFYPKKKISKSWKLSNETFWPKSYMSKTFTENFFSQTFWLAATLFICIKSFRKALNLQKDQTNEVWKRMGKVINKNLFTQATMENIFRTK